MRIKKLRKIIERGWGEKCDAFEKDCVVCRMHKALEEIEKNYKYVDRKRL